LRQGDENHGLYVISTTTHRGGGRADRKRVGAGEKAPKEKRSLAVSEMD